MKFYGKCENEKKLTDMPSSSEANRRTFTKRLW